MIACQAIALISAVGATDTVTRADVVRAIAQRHSVFEQLVVVTRSSEIGTPDAEVGHYVHCELAFAGADRLALDFAHGDARNPWDTNYWRHRSIMYGPRVLK